MTYKISRTYEFAAAHRIRGHPKCGRMHGHNYTVKVTLTGDLNLDGMVLDYGKMDEVIKPIIERFDHRYLATTDEVVDGVPPEDVRRLEGDFSTAECITRELYWLIHTKVVSDTVRVEEVEVWETPKSSATYRP